MGTIDLNAFLRNGDGGEGIAADRGDGATPGALQAVRAAEEPALRHHRLDDNELSGFGRLAVDPRTQTSRRSGEDYTVLRIAQNIRAIGSVVVTNYFDLICFGVAHHIATGLAVGQEVYFRGTFIQETLLRPGQPARLVNKVIVDYLRPVARSHSGTASP
jgi:hypothetical protein